MRQTATFDYYYGIQADSYSFYRIPKVLFTGEFFKQLSCEAKILYGLMLDRMSLSVKNRWFDDEDRVYIIFTVEEVMELLDCATQKAVKLIAELDSENGIGLIEKKRMGFGKPTIIYVKNFMLRLEAEEEVPISVEADDYEEIQENKGFPHDFENQNSHSFENQNSRVLKIENQEFRKSKFKNCENQNSRSVKIKSQEFRKSKSNNTNNNYTNINDNYYSENDINDTNLHPPLEQPVYPNKRKQIEDEVEEARSLIHTNIEYPYQCNQYRKEKVDEIVELMVEVLISKKDTISINGEQLPAILVKDRFKNIKYDHFGYICECLSKNVSKVHNIRQYMLTVIYNAPYTIEHYYQAEVMHDMHGWKMDL